MITFKTDIIRLKKIKATEIDALIKQLKEIKKPAKKHSQSICEKKLMLLAMKKLKIMIGLKR